MHEYKELINDPTLPLL